MTDDQQLQEIYASIEAAVGPENVGAALAQLETAMSLVEPEVQAVIVDNLIEDPHGTLAALDQTFADYPDDPYADLRQTYGSDVADLVEREAIRQEWEEVNAEIATVEQSFTAQGIPFDQAAFRGLLEAQEGQFYDFNEAASRYLEMVEESRDDGIEDQQLEAANIQADREHVVADRADKITDKSPATSDLDQAVVETVAESQLKAEAKASPPRANDPISGGEFGTAIDDFLATAPIIKQAHDQTLKVLDPYGEMTPGQRQGLLQDGFDGVPWRDTPETVKAQTDADRLVARRAKSRAEQGAPPLTDAQEAAERDAFTRE